LEFDQQRRLFRIKLVGRVEAAHVFEQVTDLPNLEINVFRDLAAAEIWVLAGGQNRITE
jgi:hypothetical protein